jgi:hypothetical protein
MPTRILSLGAFSEEQRRGRYSHAKGGTRVAQARVRTRREVDPPRGASGRNGTKKVCIRIRFATYDSYERVAGHRAERGATHEGHPRVRRSSCWLPSCWSASVFPLRSPAPTFGGGYLNPSPHASTKSTKALKQTAAVNRSEPGQRRPQQCTSLLLTSHPSPIQPLRTASHSPVRFALRPRERSLRPIRP